MSGTSWAWNLASAPRPQKLSPSPARPSYFASAKYACRHSQPSGASPDRRNVGQCGLRGSLPAGFNRRTSINSRISDSIQIISERSQLYIRSKSQRGLRDATLAQSIREYGRQNREPIIRLARRIHGNFFLIGDKFANHAPSPERRNRHSPKFVLKRLEHPPVFALRAFREWLESTLSTTHTRGRSSFFELCRSKIVPDQLRNCTDITGSASRQYAAAIAAQSRSGHPGQRRSKGK